MGAGWGLATWATGCDCAGHPFRQARAHTRTRLHSGAKCIATLTKTCLHHIQCLSLTPKHLLARAYAPHRTCTRPGAVWRQVPHRLFGEHAHARGSDNTLRHQRTLCACVLRHARHVCTCIMHTRPARPPSPPRRLPTWTRVHPHTHIAHALALACHTLP